MVHRRVGLGNRWCYIDADHDCHGAQRSIVDNVLRSADVFVDMGALGDWTDEARDAALRVRVDAEPGLTQIKMEQALDRGETLPEYDRYYTVGMSVGDPGCPAPTAGHDWGHLFDPVDTPSFTPVPPASMNDFPPSFETEYPVKFKAGTQQTRESLYPTTTF